MRGRPPALRPLRAARRDRGAGPSASDAFARYSTAVNVLNTADGYGGLPVKEAAR